MEAKKLPWRNAALAMLLINILATIGLALLDVLKMEGSIVLNVAIGAIALWLLTILSSAYSIDTIPKTKSENLFFLLLVLTYFGVITDNFSRALEGNSSLIWLNLILSHISYYISALTAPAFFMYQRDLFNIKTKANLVQRGVQYLMYVDLAFLMAGSCFGYIFTVSDDGIYNMHLGHYLSIIYPTSVYLICIIDNLRLPIRFRQHVALLGFNLAPLVGLGLSFYSNLALVYVATSLALLMMFIALNIENSIESANQAKTLAEKNAELTTKQFQIMVSQAQPHFIYNTLSTIYYLCGKNAELAQETVMSFSKYLRTNMDALTNNKMIAFEKELEHTSTYLSIEQLRFADILNVEYDIQYTDFYLPALTLQPLVENAVKYGIRSRKHGGTLTISTRKVNGKVYVAVHDDGMGFEPTAISQDGRIHLGIENTRKRLEMMCGGKLEINSSPEKGTTATIILQEQEYKNDKCNLCR